MVLVEFYFAAATDLIMLHKSLKQFTPGQSIKIIFITLKMFIFINN